MKKFVRCMLICMIFCMLFSACGSQSRTVQDTGGSSRPSAGRTVTTEDLEGAIYKEIEKENKDSYKDSNKFTCIMVAKSIGSSKDSYFELVIPKEIVKEDFEMPYYVYNGISLPLAIDNYEGDYTLSIKLSEYPDRKNLEELLIANLPSAINREIVSAPYGNDASYKAVYDKKDSDSPWKRTRYGVKYLKYDSENDEKDIIVAMNANFDNLTNIEIDDIYKILDVVDLKYMDSAEAENLVNDYIRESLGIEYDDSTVVEIPYAISAGLNQKYRKSGDVHNTTWTVKELREVTSIELRDHRYDAYDNYVLTESDKDWIQYLICVTDVTIQGAADISNIDFIGGLSSVQRLYIRDCDSLTDISAIQELSSLEEIYIRDCDNLTDISAIQDFQHLELITILDCDNLTNIGGIQNLPSLRNLHIDSCDNLDNIGALQDLPSLQYLTIGNCSNMVIDMKDIVDLTNLVILSIVNCAEVNNPDLIDVLSTLPNLYGFDIVTPNLERHEELK